MLIYSLEETVLLQHYTNASTAASQISDLNMHDENKRDDIYMVMLLELQLLIIFVMDYICY